jgi:DNA polymerase-3 subunit epsilon
MKSINLLPLSLEETSFSVIDFETTGMNPRQNRVIEVGIVKIKNLKIADSFSTLVNPQINIPYAISTLTGITNAEVEKAPYFEEIAWQILEFIEDDILVAHNIKFDWGFLKEELLRANFEIPTNPQLCTLTLARKMLPELRSKSLNNVARHLRVIHKNVHRALGDATVTAKILIRFLERLKNEYNIETASDLLAFQGTPSAKPFVMLKKKLASDLNTLPYAPGVYFFKNRQEEIIYIGKAKSLKNRVKNYFYSNAIKKSKEIVREADSISFKTTNSELTALIFETESIKKHNPKFNVLQKRFPTAYFLKVAGSDSFPYFKITTRIKFDGSDYFGPFPNRETAERLLETINRSFKLRECSDKEFRKGKKCYLYDIGRCLAPCEIKGIATEYAREIKKAYDFLNGETQETLNSLLSKMKRLSELQKYEEAAETRDTINLLLAQINKTSLVKGKLNEAKALIVITEGSKKDLFLLLHGKIIFKDFPEQAEPDFEQALKDYFSGMQTEFILSPRDIERLKITFSWMIKNRTKVKIFYLEEFNSPEAIFLKIVS